MFLKAILRVRCRMCFPSAQGMQQAPRIHQVNPNGGGFPSQIAGHASGQNPQLQSRTAHPHSSVEQPRASLHSCQLQESGTSRSGNPSAHFL